MKQNANEFLKRIVLQHWVATNSKIEKALGSLNLIEYASPIGPGLNTPAWIFCHLLQVNDNLLPILGIGSRMYPMLHEVMERKDLVPHAVFGLDAIKEMWVNVASKLLEDFNGMSDNEWLEKHTKISDEDFANEPHRNKMNVVLHRIIHMSHHAGQLALIKKEEVNLKSNTK